jgi:prephenate dehydrogenase
MNGDEHDRAVAGISHLPLVLAAALVEAVAGTRGAPVDGWDAARLVAASGWRDMTRLARGDVAMGTGISVSNAAPLAARIRQVQAVLEGWLQDLEAGVGPDSVAIARRLAEARALLESATAETPPVTPGDADASSP